MKAFVEFLPGLLLRVGTEREAAGRTWRLEKKGWVATDGSGAKPPPEMWRMAADWTPTMSKPMAVT